MWVYSWTSVVVTVLVTGSSMQEHTEVNRSALDAWRYASSAAASVSGMGWTW